MVACALEHISVQAALTHLLSPMSPASRTSCSMKSSLREVWKEGCFRRAGGHL